MTGPPRRAPQEVLLSVYQSLLCVSVCVAGRRCGCSYPQGPVPVPRSHLSAGAQDVAQAAAVTKTKVLGACSEKIKTKTKKETLLAFLSARATQKAYDSVPRVSPLCRFRHSSSRPRGRRPACSQTEAESSVWILHAESSRADQSAQA